MSRADGEDRPEADRGAAGQGVIAAIVAGSAAGLVVGVGDGLWSWGDAAQFVPGFGARLRWLVYLAAGYALVGALAGAVIGAGASFLFRATALGDLMRGGALAHAEARQRDPRDAVVGLALALAGVPILAGSLGAAYLIAFRELAARKHPGLVIAVAMAAALAAIAVGAILSFVAARPIELGLRRLAARPRLGRALSSPWAPPIAAAGLVTLAGIVGAVMAWDTLALLRLRPMLVALAVIALAGPLFVTAGTALAARLGRTRPALRRGAIPAGLVLALATLLLCGNAESVRKAAGAYSGLGGPVAVGVRTLGDLDRDGYSSLLGGGDCDDLDAEVHPGAVEIPDNGLDDNCVGGDATAMRDVAEVAFAPLPPELPADTNVVLITIDTLRADHLGAYGYERDTTPNLDALAKDGTLFVNSWAHAPSTRYSIPAILTGRYPLAVRYQPIARQWPGLSKENTTVAEIAQSRGLTTGAILNYWYFDPKRNMDQGFDHYDNENRRLHKATGREGPAKTSGSSSKQQTDKAIAYVDQHASDRFFLWVHYYDPHYDYEIHPGVERFGTSKIDRYDHEIRYTDQEIGRLVEHLKAAGLYERTIFIVTGDHGEGFGEHGIDLHGYHLYAAQTRVPFIVRVPGVAPSTVTMPVAHVDILPTLANLVGAEPTREMMGRSLVDVITGAAEPDGDRTVFQQLSYEGNNEMRAAASRRCHVIYNVSPEMSWELYRIDRDPRETADVIDDPGPCKDARAELEAWYDTSEIPEGAAEALLDAAPELSRETPVRFGKAELLAVELPAKVRRGETFEARWIWRAHGRLAGDWKVFAHFEGLRGGRFLGDHEPVRPFAWWNDGEYIAYSVPVAVPAGARTGRYRLFAGLFDAEGRHAAASDAVEVREDRAAVAEIEVVP